LETIRVFVIRENKIGIQTIRKYIPGEYYPSFEPAYENLVFTDDMNSADIFIIINNPPQHSCPAERVIYYKTEPDEFYYVPHYWLKPWVEKESKFFPMDEKHPRIQTWDLHKDWTTLFRDNFRDKHWLMQVVTTNYGDGTQVEQQLSGHIARMKFLKKFLDNHGYRKDVWRLWGRRLENYHYPVNFGEIYDKFDALWDSKYTFAFMNSVQPGFFDEKVTDAILCNCMPIVYGCPNLEQILPEHSFIRLDITKEDAVDKAWDLINSDYYEKHKDALGEAKKLILNKLSIIPRLHHDIGRI